MASWAFRKLNPNDNSGGTTFDENFADEQCSSADILVRETIQNPLDARSNGEPVRVRYFITSVRSAGSLLVGSLFQSSWCMHEAASEGRAIRHIPESISFLVIEDFGTS